MHLPVQFLSLRCELDLSPSPVPTILCPFHEPVERWQTTNVTLLGDAIHTMTPARGVGGNTALRDAELLHHKLVDVATGGVPLVQAKEEYETAMLRYGFEAVANSLNAPFFSPEGRPK